MNGQYCVYVHTNKINGKRYVGQTKKNPLVRWGKNGKNYKGCRKFYNAILKYGWDNFEHVILNSGLSKQEADTLEKKYIKEYKTREQKYGYNIEFGGSTKEWSEESKEIMRMHRLGKKLSEETKRKVGEALVGHIAWNRGKKGVYSEETIEKMRRAHIGKKFRRTKFRPLSEEQKIKISKKLKGRHTSMNTEIKKGQKWFNNGAINVISFVCPDGFVHGRIKRR